MDGQDNLQDALGVTYRVERELGGGGMSRVFVARDIGLDRRVVVKVLPAQYAAGARAEAFRREIQLAAGLAHPHIVPILAAGEVGGVPYYTMPYIEGESLRVRLARHTRTPIPEVLRILHDVSDALAYAHARGVVHRDIKPDNVLMSGAHAVISDFGVAKALFAASSCSEGETGFAIGTPAYMAPEQAAADPHIDHRADLYAFGVLAYELLANRPPFNDRTPLELMVAQVTEAPAPIGGLRYDVPDALADIIMSCLEKNPDDRPVSASEIRDRIEAIAFANASLLVPRPPRTVRHRGAQAAAAVLAFVASLTGLTMFGGAERGHRLAAVAPAAAAAPAELAFAPSGPARIAHEVAHAHARSTPATAPAETMRDPAPAPAPPSSGAAVQARDGNQTSERGRPSAPDRRHRNTPPRRTPAPPPMEALLPPPPGAGHVVLRTPLVPGVDASVRIRVDTTQLARELRQALELMRDSLLRQVAPAAARVVTRATTEECDESRKPTPSATRTASNAPEPTQRVRLLQAARAVRQAARVEAANTSEIAAMQRRAEESLRDATEGARRIELAELERLLH